MYIPENAPLELRQMVEGFENELAALRMESDVMQRDPDACADEYKADLLARVNSAAVDLELIKLRCKQFGYEWVDWPDVIF